MGKKELPLLMRLSLMPYNYYKEKYQKEELNLFMKLCRQLKKNKLLTSIFFFPEIPSQLYSRISSKNHFMLQVFFLCFTGNPFSSKFYLN